ncbi:hypothetical protein GCM10023195_24610 [Actinoallomurus liliacearum]|uniref:Transposase n=1 Tax=Actinoallomurus liliacearum TaxID=1080073 RepID=A0ABP8TFC1_9ACTN
MLRTARVGLRLTPAQRRRCFGLLVAAGDVWACVLDMNRWRRQRGLAPIINFQQLCRELHQAGPGAFGELNSVCAEGVLRRYSDAWFAAAKRRAEGDTSARFPRRKRRLMPVRFRYGSFAIDGQRLRLAVARGRPPLWVRGRRQHRPPQRGRTHHHQREESVPGGDHAPSSRTASPRCRTVPA